MLHPSSVPCVKTREKEIEAMWESTGRQGGEGVGGGAVSPVDGVNKVKGGRGEHPHPQQAGLKILSSD